MYLIMKYIKKSIPIIVVFDILVLLLFAYISMPHKNKELVFFIEFKNGIMDGAFVQEAKDSGVKNYIIKHGELKEVNESIKSWFHGFDCGINSLCSRVLNIENRDMGTDYSIFFPDSRVMMPALALWYNFCANEKCNGAIYIDASDGRSFLCGADGFYKYYDSYEKDIISTKQCEFKIKG